MKQTKHRPDGADALLLELAELRVTMSTHRLDQEKLAAELSKNVGQMKAFIAYRQHALANRMDKLKQVNLFFEDHLPDSWTTDLQATL